MDGHDKKFRFFAVIGLLLGFGALVSCQKTPEDELVGKWEVIGVEYEEKFIPLDERLELAKVPGLRNLTSAGFEMKASGQYRAGESLGKWKIVAPGLYQIAYDVHGKDYILKVVYERKGDRLRIQKPEGEFWIVLEN